MRFRRWLSLGLLSALFAAGGTEASAAPPAATAARRPASPRPAARPKNPEASARRAAAATLVRLLADPDPYVRGQAQTALSRTRPPEAVPLLVARLRNPDPALVNSAMEVLAWIRTREAVQALLRFAEQEKGAVRVKIAQVLSYHASALPELHAFYERLSREDDQYLRLVATSALGNMLLPANDPFRFSVPNPTAQSDPNSLAPPPVPADATARSPEAAPGVSRRF